MALASSPLDPQRSPSYYSDRLDQATSMSRNLQSFLFQQSPRNNTPKPSSSKFGSSFRFYPTASTTTTATSLASSPSFIQRPRRLRSKTSSIFPAPNLSNSPPDNYEKLSARRSLFPFQKDISFDIEFEHSLPHKTSYFDLRAKDHDDIDMDSDSNNSSSSSSIFSDAEEDDEFKPPLSHINSNISLFSTASTSSSASTSDSYFTHNHSEIPTKLSRHRMKSISNASSILSNKPELSWNGTPEQKRGAPTKSSANRVAWGMPSFASNSPTTPVYPRHCKVRRTQSMFEHPQDVMSSDVKEEAELSSSPSIDGCQSILAREDCPIKSFTVEQDPFRRIDRDTLCEILDGQHKELYDRHVVIDCRFEYEYEGGHIDGAININSKETLEKVLISPASSTERTLLVFHCEYSAHRGPRMAMHLRSIDRQVNMNRYPMLHYPDIVILAGGYSHFFAEHDSRCFPQHYVGMNDNADACEREMDKFRRTMKTTRTQSYTYGANNNTSSPVAASRSQSAFTTFRFPPRDESSDMDSSDSSINLNDTTPTQPVARRRLGVPKLAQCKLFN